MQKNKDTALKKGRLKLLVIVGWVEARNPTNQQDIYKCDFEAHPCHYILLNKTTDTFKNQHKTKNKC